MTRVLVGAGDSVKEFIKSLGLDPDMTRRVILDINAADVVTMYIEEFVDKEFFDLRTTLELRDMAPVQRLLRGVKE